MFFGFSRRKRSGGKETSGTNKVYSKKLKGAAVVAQELADELISEYGLTKADLADEDALMVMCNFSSQVYGEIKIVSGPMIFTNLKRSLKNL